MAQRVKVAENEPGLYAQLFKMQYARIGGDDQVAVLGFETRGGEVRRPGDVALFHGTSIMPAPTRASSDGAPQRR